MSYFQRTKKILFFLGFGIVASANAALACIGDCNGDRSVTIDELVTMVNIALGTTPLTVCSAGDANSDSEITIDEIIGAVNNALNGCPTADTCTNAFATVILAFNPSEVPNLAGVTLDVTYPPRHVSFPADEIQDRILDVSDAGGFFDAQADPGVVFGSGLLRISYVTQGELRPGSLLEITFDCISATPPEEADFQCLIRQASDGGGFDVQGVACQVAVDLD